MLIPVLFSSDFIKETKTIMVEKEKSRDPTKETNQDKTD